MPKAFLPALEPHRVVVALPSLDTDDLVAVGEVLWQEELRTWSVGRIDDLEALTPVFGRRAVIGVHGPTTCDDAAEAAAHGADFVSAPWAVPGIVTAVGHTPSILSGLTPTELVAACALGPAVVQVYPADAIRQPYTSAVLDAINTPLIATGRLTPRQALDWLEAGATAVCPTDLVTADLVTGAALDGLRARCQRWQFGG